MEEWFSEKLIQWYSIHQRDLPWRQENDPYRIWLSEIILQQTQVKQGLKYYHQFIKNYPNVNRLARAKEDEVLKLWQGLGYYSRARNLHAAAKHIAFELNGEFPKDYKQIRLLKGVGDYTAAAIASFAYNLPHAVVDGNVYRLLSRVFDIELPIDSSLGKKTYQSLAQKLLPNKKAAIYNQAIMEFGSQFCKPRSPNCEDCIFVSKCQAYRINKVQQRPVKSKTTKIRSRYFNYVVFIGPNKTTYLRKREGSDIWKGLYEFPVLESNKSISSQLIIKQTETQFSLSGLSDQLIFKSKQYKHLLSHQTIYARVMVFKSNKFPIKKFGITVKLNRLEDYAFPQLLVKFIRDCKLEEIV